MAPETGSTRAESSAAGLGLMRSSRRVRLRRPSERVWRPGCAAASAITREWGVALATATRALAELRDEGLVYAQPGVGTLVSARPVRTRGNRESSDTPITADDVVETAIAVADSEGLGTVSMRRVAIELHVPTMALYRHVRGKNNLFR